MGKGKSKDSGNEVRTGWKKQAKLKAFCDFVCCSSPRWQEEWRIFEKGRG